MGYIYYVRHGETTWNVANKVCGQIDVPLTERGHSQAIALGKRIAEEGIHIDEFCIPHWNGLEIQRNIFPKRREFLCGRSRD